MLELACEASVSVEFGTFFGSLPIFRARRQNTENPVPRSVFAPKPHRNACYAGYVRIKLGLLVPYLCRELDLFRHKLSYHRHHHHHYHHHHPSEEPISVTVQHSWPLSVLWSINKLAVHTQADLSPHQASLLELLCPLCCIKLRINLVKWIGLKLRDS